MLKMLGLFLFTALLSSAFGQEVQYLHEKQYSWKPGVLPRAVEIMNAQSSMPDNTGVVHKNFAINKHLYQMVYTSNINGTMFRKLSHALPHLNNGTRIYKTIKIDSEHYVSLFDMVNAPTSEPIRSPSPPKPMCSAGFEISEKNKVPVFKGVRSLLKEMLLGFDLACPQGDAHCDSTRIFRGNLHCMGDWHLVGGYSKAQRASIRQELAKHWGTGKPGSLCGEVYAESYAFSQQYSGNCKGTVFVKAIKMTTDEPSSPQVVYHAAASPGVHNTYGVF